MNIQSSMLLVSISMMSLAGCASKTERQFISGCKTGGIEGDVCECIYDKLEKKYGEDDLKNNMYTLDQSERFQRDMANTAYRCMKE